MDIKNSGYLNKEQLFSISTCSFLFHNQIAFLNDKETYRCALVSTLCLQAHKYFQTCRKYETEMENSVSCFSSIISVSKSSFSNFVFFSSILLFFLFQFFKSKHTSNVKKILHSRSKVQAVMCRLRVIRTEQNAYLGTFYFSFRLTQVTSLGKIFLRASAKQELIFGQDFLWPLRKSISLFTNLQGTRFPHYWHRDVSFLVAEKKSSLTCFFHHFSRGYSSSITDTKRMS
jgi:hypothetical protein